MKCKHCDKEIIFDDGQKSWYHFSLNFHYKSCYHNSIYYKPRTIAEPDIKHYRKLKLERVW
jgi:hypothetical protein